MRKKLGFLLLGAFIIACLYLWSAHRHTNPEAVVQEIRAGMDRHTNLEAVVQEIRADMSEGEVRTAMKTVALDSGTVYFGGSGAKRLYFELPQQRQVWVECAGASGSWKVVEVGHIEPKQRWVRFTGDSIIAE